MPRDQERRSAGEGAVTWDESIQRWTGRLPRDERGRRPKVTGKTKREAERKLERRLAEREQGILGAGRMTVRQFLEQWVRDTLMVADLADSTKAKHEIAVRLHLVPALGRIKLVKLTPMHVQRFLRDELAAGKGPATVKQAHTTLRMALKQAVLWGLVPRNAAALVDGVSYRTPERQPFTPDEQRRILNVAKGDRLYIMVVLAHATGLRQSELLGVRWSDLDLDARVLRFRVQYGRDGVLRPPKTAAGVRVLPLSAFAVEALRVHRAAQQAERAAADAWEDRWDLVIATRNGRPVNHANARRSWNRIVERAGVEHRGIHCMRHAWVTMLAERGVHQRVAQQLAGHADGRMTAQVYTHVTPPMFDATAAVIDQAMDDLLGSKDGSKAADEPDEDEQ